MIWYVKKTHLCYISYIIYGTTPPKTMNSHLISPTFFASTPAMGGSSSMQSDWRLAVPGAIGGVFDFQQGNIGM